MRVSGATLVGVGGHETYREEGGEEIVREGVVHVADLDERLGVVLRRRDRRVRRVDNHCTRYGHIRSSTGTEKANAHAPVTPSVYCVMSAADV